MTKEFINTEGKHVVVQDGAASSRSTLPPYHTVLTAGVVAVKGGLIGTIASRDLKTRVLPKGHVETGESTLEAAFREAAEELGVTGIISNPPVVESFFNTTDKSVILVEWYLLEVTGKAPEQEDRSPKWIEPMHMSLQAGLTFPGHQLVVQRLMGLKGEV